MLCFTYKVIYFANMNSRILVFLIFNFLNITLNAQYIPIVKFDFYENLRAKQNDTTYVVNFWATWCKPCVNELPYLEQIKETYKNDKLQVVLLSLDFKKQYDTKLKPFVEKRKIKSQVVLLDEPNYNLWIDKVDSTWGGAIPATVIFNNDKKYYQFFEREITFEELNQIIKPLIQ